MTLQETNSGYLTGDVFKMVIDNTPLVSVDLIVKHNSKVLLGKRVNKPAQGYWFTLGGRVLKNETIQSAIQRIGKLELDIIIDKNPKFIGVFEHLYNDSIFDDGSNTSCTPLALNADTPVVKTKEGCNEVKNKEIRNTHINIGTGVDISIKELAETIKEIIGFNGELYFNVDKPDGTIKKLTDVSKLNGLGWKHTVELESGIEKMYKWYLGDKT